MITLVLLVLANFGFAYIVGFSKISAGVRYALSPIVVKDDGIELVKFPTMLNLARYWLVYLIECPGCVGFHTGGLLTAYLIGYADGLGLPHIFPAWAAVFLGACATSGSNFILGRLTKII